MKKTCLFVSDLHGKVNRYEKLFRYVETQEPYAVFLGGDLLPSSVLHSFRAGENKPDFVSDYLAARFQQLKDNLKAKYPRVFVIMGNDDPCIEEVTFLEYEKNGLWEYVHARFASLDRYKVLGYNFVPPTPFLLKDWEKYDMDNTVKPGCIAPDEGFLTDTQIQDKGKNTISKDLRDITGDNSLTDTICLFHSPPYQSGLDRVALDGVSLDDQKMDVHVGSMAIRQLIEKQKPYITLHGHIHESSRLTGVWKEKIQQTVMLSAAFEGPGLAVIKFDLNNPVEAERIVL